MPTAIFVMGLQGAGKSKYIEEVIGKPEEGMTTMVDSESCWELVSKVHPEMDRYEQATWVKACITESFLTSLALGPNILVLEITGMSKVNQALVTYLADHAEAIGYEVKFVYIAVFDQKAFFERVKDDQQALSMAQDWKRQHVRWRSPTQCPRFKDALEVVKV